MPMNETEYRAALDEVSRLMDCAPDTLERGRLLALVAAVAEYEEEHYPVSKPDVFAVIGYWLESRRRYAGWPAWFRCSLVAACYFVSSLLSLARDLCETVYASYPSEAEDGFERALAESRPAEQEPWATGRW